MTSTAAGTAAAARAASTRSATPDDAVGYGSQAVQRVERCRLDDPFRRRSVDTAHPDQVHLRSGVQVERVDTRYTAELVEQRRAGLEHAGRCSTYDQIDAMPLDLASLLDPKRTALGALAVVRALSGASLSEAPTPFPGVGGP